MKARSVVVLLVLAIAAIVLVMPFELAAVQAFASPVNPVPLPSPVPCVTETDPLCWFCKQQADCTWDCLMRRFICSCDDPPSECDIVTWFVYGLPESQCSSEWSAPRPTAGCSPRLSLPAPLEPAPKKLYLPLVLK